MTIRIFDHKLRGNSHNLYDVTFFQDTIYTIVTKTPSYVDKWISDTQHILCCGPHPLIVGLDVEWLPNRIKNCENPVATIQLCVGRRCLIFQILHSPIIPYSLLNFLGNPSYIFTGVGIKDDVKKLRKEYYLVVARTLDLRTLAAAAYGVRELKDAGLKKLSSWVLGKDISKPKVVTMSSWNDRSLTTAQVQYACIDAFLSFEICRILISNFTINDLGLSVFHI